MTDRKSIMRGIVLDHNATFTLTEFCEVCGIETTRVMEMIGEGIIDPIDGEKENDQFSGEALLRARRAMRLVDDLGVNWPGAALALDLLDELEGHRRQLDWFRERTRRKR